MARPQRNRDGFDTIDLTLSSPEPESPPRTKEQIRVPSQQPQSYSGWPHSAPRVKPETGHLPRIIPEPGQPSRVHKNFSPLAASNRAPGSSQQTRQIHPNHLNAILASTDPHDLRKVLLELCQLSPALSGALVRGLAPYSISARGIVSKHRPYPQFREPVPLDDNERRLAGHTPYSSQRNRLPWQRPGDQTSSARQHTHAFQPTLRTEREPYRPSTPNDWHPMLSRPSTSSPDRELRRPGPSAQKVVHPNATRTPLQNLPKGSSNINHTSDADVVTQKASSQTTETCVKCHEPFSDNSQPCIYHPGGRMKQEDGRIVWSCCYEDMLSVGCDFGGHHIAE